MVKASDTLKNQPARVDAAEWLALMEAGFREDGAADTSIIGKSLSLIQRLPSRSVEFQEKGIELANLVRTLNMDAAAVAAALLYRAVRTDSVSLLMVERAVAPEVARLVGAVAQMADTSLLEMTNSRMQTSESRDQVENIKRMLVAMMDDARVAVLKLAERVVALRAAKTATVERQLRIAQEAHQVFAPLASRLGVWQLKWELEDLALRYLAPDIYKAIAGQLDGRRQEREAEIQAIVEAMEARLAQSGIKATISGRAKHIYSIWRKMRSKNVGLDEVYDVRAIRVMVPDIAQCYAALGVIHTQWQHLPSEFDDYIAVPKENGYRSIHTAVSWNDGKTLEVQIRTLQMHEEAELGVCAHWAYKDGVSEDTTYAQKMNWMRQVVDWQEQAEDPVLGGDLSAALGASVREERIFVYTPKGHVLDLITGATALDFAYRVHTEIGHRCRGAKVDGWPVALNAPLQSGQRVEVLTSETAEPQRAWLHAHLDCIRTSRARQKIADWFRARPDSVNAAEGKALLESTFKRLGVVSSMSLDALARQLGYDAVRGFLIALAVGECQILDVLRVALGLGGDVSQGAGPDEASPRGGRSLPAQLSLLGDAQDDTGSATSYRIEISADDRPGLLMDITSYLGRHSITLLSNVGRVVPETGIALIEIEVRLDDPLSLLRLMDGLGQIPAVLETRRLPT